MSLEYTVRRYKFRKYDTAQPKEAVENLHVFDDRFNFDVKTLELAGRPRLSLTVKPVLSIPLKYNSVRKVFEIQEGGMAVDALVKGYYYGSSLPSETQVGEYEIALDENHRLYVRADIAESLLTNIKDRLNSSLSSYAATLYGADLTAPQSIELNTGGRRLLEVYASASTATTFHLDVSPDNTNWIEDYKVYSGVSEVKDTLWNGFQYVRLRSDAAGAAGDTVTLILSAK